MGNNGDPNESRSWYCHANCRKCLFILVFIFLSFLYYMYTVDKLDNWRSKGWNFFHKTKWRNKSKGHDEINSSVTPGPAGVTENRKLPWSEYYVEYPYDYHYVMNEPHKCEEQNTFVVLIVPVAPHNRKIRDMIRQTWGGESKVLGKVITLFFLLGLTAAESVQQIQHQLLLESKEHRDLIQGDFLDCYRNLTIKTMVMLEWLDNYCSTASYAMKIDSDMFLNLPNLVKMLLNAPKTNYMTGLVARDGYVLRDPKSKWYVPMAVYPNLKYPVYVLGLGYILSLDLPKKLLSASRHVRAIYIEDVYLGMCMQYLKIPPTNPPGWAQFHVFPVPYNRCRYTKLVATTINMNLLKIWKDFNSTSHTC